MAWQATLFVKFAAGTKRFFQRPCSRYWRVPDPRLAQTRSTNRPIRRTGANIFAVTVTTSDYFRASDWLAPARCLFGATNGVSAPTFLKCKALESIHSISRDSSSAEPCLLAGTFDFAALIGRLQIAQSFRLVWDEMLGISVVGHLAGNDFLANRTSAKIPRNGQSLHLVQG